MCSKHVANIIYIYVYLSIGFGGPDVVCWPLVTKFAGFKPGRSRWIFKGKKSSAFLPSEGKQNRLSHVADLRHVKISRITWKSNSRRNLSEHFSPTKSSTFRCQRSLASWDVKALSGEGENV